MKAKLQSLFDNNRGVSPVIGVILMVAITVILAAVIGTFVLGLGGNLEQTPQAQIGVEAGDAADQVDISHRGGDTLQVSDLRLVDDNGNVLSDEVQSGTWSDEFAVGDSITLEGSAGDGNLPTGGNEATIRIIHQPSDSIIVEKTVTVPSS